MLIWKCAKNEGKVKAKTFKQALDDARRKLSKSRAGKLVRVVIMNDDKEKLGEWSIRIPA